MRPTRSTGQEYSTTSAGKSSAIEGWELVSASVVLDDLGLVDPCHTSRTLPLLFGALLTLYLLVVFGSWTFPVLCKCIHVPRRHRRSGGVAEWVERSRAEDRQRRGGEEEKSGCWSQPGMGRGQRGRGRECDHRKGAHPDGPIVVLVMLFWAGSDSIRPIPAAAAALSSIFVLAPSSIYQ